MMHNILWSKIMHESYDMHDPADKYIPKNNIMITER